MYVHKIRNLNYRRREICMRRQEKKEHKSVKNEVMTVRVSREEKAKYSAEAHRYGMNLSEYILYLMKHKELKVIEGGANIANAIYDLNCNISKYHENEEVPIMELKKAILTCIKEMNRYCENIKENE